MAVIRINHQKNYVVINKEALEDPNLSFKAKGLWAYCMSRPNDWEFHVSHLAQVSKDGEDAIYSAIKELVKEGYCDRVQGKENGRYTSVDYLIREIKIILPHRDFPLPEKQRTENPALLSIDSNQVLKKKDPPLTPPKEPAPKMTKEELRRRISSNWSNEEFEYAWKRLQSSKNRIIKAQAYLEACMQEYRNSEALKKESGDRAERHRKQAMRLDGRKVGGEYINVRENKVEFTCGTYYNAVPFDIPDEEWEEKTSKWLK